MNGRHVIRRNLKHYQRFYILIALATAIMVAVTTGSLMVGDSVRMTLVQRVNERLGSTESVIFNGSGYMDASLVNELSGNAWGTIMTDGFIQMNGRLIPVNVWGVDYLRNGTVVDNGDAIINVPLAKEAGIGADDDIVLRLPKNGLIPSGSLFVTQNYTTSLRLSCTGVVEAIDGGNLSLKNEQTLPFNVFVNRGMLNDLLETGDKVNVILSDVKVSTNDINQAWRVEMAGMRSTRKEDCTEIITERVFMQDGLIDFLCKHHQQPNRLYSYLANTIRLGEKSVPYSFVTAMDSYGGKPLEADDILLSDYTARRIGAKVGDVIHVSYFKMKGLKRLETDSIQLKVSAIIPMQEWLADGTLSAEFPGLTDVERCTEWDSDLPINMELITDEDEEYWTDYRSTPKAIVPYNSVINDWKTVFGSATAVRIQDQQADFSGIDAQMCGIQVVHPREAGIYGAMNGVDFAGLFLALGFFIIVSALLLMYSPLSEMFWQRRHEISLWQALGWPRSRIIGMFWREALPVILVAVLIGIIIGNLYTWLIVFLLGNVWQGATQTDGFSIVTTPQTLLVGFAISMLLSITVLWLALRHAFDFMVKDTKRSGAFNLKGRWIVTLLTIALLLVAVFVRQSVILFVLLGCMWIVLGLFWGWHWLLMRGNASSIFNDRKQLVWNSLFANRKQAVVSFLTLALGVFIVFAVGLNRKGFGDSSQLTAGTGGYSLWVETAVPVYYDMNTQEGRRQLSLTELPANVSAMQFLRYSADDASCLNLNKVSTPTVLGVDMNQFTQAFHAQCSMYNLLVDETVLTWGLMKNIGDTLYYQNSHGEEVKLVIAGTLPNTILQGNVVVDREVFAEIWPEITGSEVALVKVKEQENEQTKNLLATALNEYGVRVMTTGERLRQFYQVTDTYLTIFLTLGGIGLLVGLLSFVIVIRKNLAMKDNDIQFFGMLGYQPQVVERLLVDEHIRVPLYALFIGVTGAMLSACIGFANVSWSTWLLCLVFAILLVTSVIYFVKKVVKTKIGSLVSNEHIGRLLF